MIRICKKKQCKTRLATNWKKSSSDENLNLIELRPEWKEKGKAAEGVVLTEKEEKELKPIEKVCLIMTRNKDDEKELYEMLGTKEARKELDR